MPLAPTLDTIGLLARDAADLLPVAPILADMRQAEPIRRAVLLNDIVRLCTPSIMRACSALVDALEAAGIAVSRQDALAAIDTIDAHALTIMSAESARVHRARIDDPVISSVLRRRLAKGLEVSDDALTASIAARPRLIKDFATHVLGSSDAVVLPVMAIDTPSVAECDPASDQFAPKTLYAMSRLTRWVNALGLPAVALPAGFDSSDMPVAIQIVGQPGSDLALLDLVRHVQSQDRLAWPRSDRDR